MNKRRENAGKNSRIEFFSPPESDWRDGKHHQNLAVLVGKEILRIGAQIVALNVGFAMGKSKF